MASNEPAGKLQAVAFLVRRQNLPELPSRPLPRRFVELDGGQACRMAGLERSPSGPDVVADDQDAIARDVEPAPDRLVVPPSAPEPSTCDSDCNGRTSARLSSSRGLAGSPRCRLVYRRPIVSKLVAMRSGGGGGAKLTGGSGARVRGTDLPPHASS